MSIIIPRGTKIPVQKEHNYLTSCDNQEEIYVGIFEGEKKYVNDNHLLGEFCLSNLPKRPEGEVSVTVTYSIDTNGILTVTAEEISKGIKNSIKIINDKGFNEEEIIKEIKNSNLTVVKDDNKEVKNYKKYMSDYIKFYNETYNPQEKYKYIFNFTETLVNFINTFEKEGNDTLGNKYFLYIKALFGAYKTIIQLRNNMTNNEINNLLNNCKNFLKILSTFKNINYKHYIELLYLFLIPLSKEEKKKPLEKQKQITESRNHILFELTTYVIELVEEKAEQILSCQLKFSRYNAKYLFQNCIQISELK